MSDSLQFIVMSAPLNSRRNGTSSWLHVCPFYITPQYFATFMQCSAFSANVTLIRTFFTSGPTKWKQKVFVKHDDDLSRTRTLVYKDFFVVSIILRITSTIFSILRLKVSLFNGQIFFIVADDNEPTLFLGYINFQNRIVSNKCAT